MTYKEALEFMCKRCTNYDVCQGTGCTPKKTIADLIDQTETKLIYYEMLEQEGRLVILPDPLHQTEMTKAEALEVCEELRQIIEQLP